MKDMLINITSSILAVLIMVLSGIGIGYIMYTNNKVIVLFDNDNVKEIDKFKNNNDHIKNVIDNSNNNVITKNTFRDGDFDVIIENLGTEWFKITVNNFDITNELEGDYISTYKVNNDLLFIETQGVTGATKLLYIYNTFAKQIFALNEFDNGLWYVSYNIVDNIIKLKGGVIRENAQSHKYFQEDLFSMDCSTLKKYSNLIVETEYEMKYLGDNIFSNIEITKEIPLKDSSYNDRLSNICRYNESINITI